MRNRVFWLSLVLAVVSVSILSITASPRIAEARTGDVCEMVVWDSTGTVLEDGDTVGGDGSFFMIFRVEDDAFGFVNDFLNGPVQDLIDETVGADIANVQAQIEAKEIELAEAQEALDLDPDNELLQYQVQQLEYDLFGLQEELAAHEEILREIVAALLHFQDVNVVRIDSQDGSAVISSYLEVIGFEWITPKAGHVLTNGDVRSQKVDHIFPDFFAGPDGNDVDSIRDWLARYSGAPVPAGLNTADNVCGGSNTDGWGFVDLNCTNAGSFHLRVIPDWSLVPRDFGESPILHGARNLKCPGYADTAEIAASPASVEVEPAPGNTDKSTITVTVKDQDGDNMDGVGVKFITNNCKFKNPYEGEAGDHGISPIGGGTTVETFSDTDSSADGTILTNNPLQTDAGTAELTLDCSGGDPGTADVTAIVERLGADIELKVSVAVVGPTASTGLKLTLTPDSLQCGDILLATAKAVDDNGVNVSNNTRIYFTTDTSSGIVGGVEGGQGSNTTIDGEATVTIAVSPTDVGPHSVIAWTIDKNGVLLAQTSAPFNCHAAAATVAGVTSAPPAGTVNNITPPNTGSAGLAGGDTSVNTLAWIASVATFGISLVGFSANRLCLIGRRR